VLTTDPDRREMPAPWDIRTHRRREEARAADAADAAAEQAAERAERAAQRAADGPGHHAGLTDLSAQAVRSALGVAAEAAGLPGALVRTLAKGVRNETSSISLHAPRTIFNQKITGSRRFAAQRWPIERLRTIGQATGTTINDVVLAMCSGAVRSYLLELDALPDAPLVAMVPVGLKAKESAIASTEGGNAIGAVMCRLGTDLADPADRLESIHRSMLDGKQALSSMTSTQILAMSALGQAPAIVAPLLRMQGIVRPPYNLIISNVPGPRTTHYWNGARLTGNYPLSIPIDGMALNITCTSYDGDVDFGLIGCRRTVPHLQRLLVHLDDELEALEKAAGA
jgi:diacylglycerol O-acyltransferase